MIATSQRDILQQLREFSDVIPRVEAELMLSHILKCTHLELYINDITLCGETLSQSNAFINRRLAGEPLQYIIGTAEFMSRDFLVNKDVFIPRPETELLVNEVLLPTANCQLPIHILDLCTGCGNIAVSLANLLPNAKIVATDISGAALDVAKSNSILHAVDKKIKFYKGDLFEALLLDKKYNFDIIVCNPPYVNRSELKFLQKEVSYEPEVALDGGVDGLDFYRRIAKEAPLYLKPGGRLFLEMGFGQADDVKDIFNRTGKLEILSVRKDFAGIERVITCGL